ncbi:MAG: 3-hydroxyacyl-CoA dehydrogenase/enoyl-CoA hydratase family protein [Calditrichaeota bacterium]|nr:MAG: 3-hydroxyacyl-CoA dehydrogenase/enoyl-CoA hydratase family protein [Calditrichota bacterium]
MKESTFKKVAVLGTGVMGSQIAAHLANAGIPSLAFDISQEVAEKGIQAAARLKPAPFFDPRAVSLITPCNYQEHLPLLQEVDWVIEAVVERLDIKQAIFQKITPHLRPEAIISSNTSGLSLKDMSAVMPETYRRRFLVTHFFNPPRYMHLLEIVPSEHTDPEVVQAVVTFCENVLGKGIVYAKDTPNFIANRIGVYGMMLTLQLASEMGLSVEEVDALTGPVLGRPKSATFRTADVVGLDTLAHVARTAYEKCTHDEEREVFRIPDFLQQMIDKGMTGQKAGAGFYRKEGKQIFALDLKTMEYRPAQKPDFEALKQVKRLPRTADRIRALAAAEDRAGRFVWEMLARTLIYSAHRIPEIADDIVNVDNAMRWGFGWEFGPFQTWDILGLADSLARMKKEGKTVPEWVEKAAASETPAFYTSSTGTRYFFDLKSGSHQPVVYPPRVIHLDLEQEKRPVRARSENASLVDLGDGVLCLAFHHAHQPAMNPIDPDMLQLAAQAVEIIQKEGVKGLLITHQAQNFSVGANLAMVAKLCQEQRWSDIDRLSKQFQDIGQALKYAPFPVVSAPFNMTLGGGYEIAAAANRIVASAELYAGLVEVGVGLIPGGGGTLRLLLNWMQLLAPRKPGPFPPVQKAFETIAYAKVSSSAVEARKLGLLMPEDRHVMNPDHLIYEGKQEVLRMAEGYQPPEPQKEIYLPGEGGRLVIESSLEDMLKAGQISEYDLHIGSQLAYVLTGGDKASPAQPVHEQYLLDLEREVFVSLCQQPKTQERILHMLKTGKPLRN